MDEYVRGLHGINLSISPFGWFVLNHPLFFTAEGTKYMNLDSNPDKPETTNDKHQMTNKFQITTSKSAAGGSNANFLGF
jgi:hypothetical protein